jgi:hypothetical protein
VTDQPSEEPSAGDGTTPAGHEGQAILASQWAVALGGVALVLIMVFPPAAPLPAAAALFVGVRARRRARRSRTNERGARAGVVLGSVALAISIPLATMRIVLWGAVDHYLACREAANTITDERACKDALFQQMEKKLDLPQGGLQRHNLPL